ncbi:YceI family protein [Aquabacterium sp. OR-4]|uniref:YceI family protein n=1 Tax=Aquabacterium sp. OR-4 TaxID=2978127 RepID=UPI0021B30D97|nr:YceI family protein [Aquabacterium sp. OR-4]MDT7837743.1 YceI family protein [Aquabacterium sp. OR-4]
MIKLHSGLSATALALLAAAATPSLAQQVDTAKSEIGFVSKQMGVPVEGKFKKWTAQIAFDPKKAAAGKVAFTIETGSASFGTAETDAEVVKPAWFNVPKFPQASFTSTTIKPLGAGKFEVAGKLSIKGNSRDVVVPVTVVQNGALSTATGAFAMKRLEFKIGEGEWADTSMVADEVQVKFKLALTGLGPL